MNDFSNLEKSIVRELSCRLCLCSDVVKLKPLSNESKRKLRKLFDIEVKKDDYLPKAICHDCLQQVATMHLYAVKVEKTQKFLQFYKMKSLEEKKDTSPERKMQAIISSIVPENAKAEKIVAKGRPPDPSETHHQQGDSKTPPKPGKKASEDMKYMESMPLEEFVKTENIDKALLSSTKSQMQPTEKKDRHHKNRAESIYRIETGSALDSEVLVDGRPAKSGAELDKQITLFYKMECCICHENGFHFRSLMKHYKDRHGVPGYVTCCDLKFHYFYPKKIIEHMAYHLQPNIFMCPSCHTNFSTSQDLNEHIQNGGRSEGKVVCPRCKERYPTYHELGHHLISHRIPEEKHCDYCGKPLKHYHRKQHVHGMENVILCSVCTRTLKHAEKQDKDIAKDKSKDTNTSKKLNKFKQAMGLSTDEEDEEPTE